MPTEQEGKSRIHAFISTELKARVIAAMKGGESLTKFIETSLLAEVERRTQGAPGTGTPGLHKLPRGKRPRP